MRDSHTRATDVQSFQTLNCLRNILDLKRQVDPVFSKRRESGVVHDRAQRMADGIP